MSATDPAWLTGLLTDFRRNGGGEVPTPPAPGVDLRPAPDLPEGNYLARPHAELIALVAEDADPDEVGRLGALYREAGAAMAGFCDDVAAAVRESGPDWQGAAGEAARRFLSETGAWAARAGGAAQQAGDRLDEQAAALASARNAMPAERPFDYDAAMADLRATTDPIAFATKAAGYAEEYRRSRAAHEEAARVLAQYDRRLAEASALPAFAPPPSAGGSVPPPRGASHAG
ncbi:hypothetical protein ACFQV2_37265 [Actinokineospora soli]|uniref:PPE family protein n=1 Tax=Actinokineospora soli TaxID=1048753 RepID=A0ABW2TWG5_9PSEU